MRVSIFLLSFFFSFNSFIIAQSWQQVGQDIVGEAVDDQSGRPVAISGDGTTIVIGARFNDGNGANSGHIRVYRISGVNWTQVGQDIDGEAQEDEFGASVSISENGNRIAVGAPNNSANGAYSGHVRVFEYANNTWTQLGQDIDGPYQGVFSGRYRTVNLSMDGNRVVIGHQKPSQSSSNDNHGHVRVYQYSGGNWTQVGQAIDGIGIFNRTSINGNGSIIGVGSYNHNNSNGDQAGTTRMYQLQGNVWTQIGQDIYGEAAYDISGGKISLNGDGLTVAIGAMSASGNGAGMNRAGHVRVYRYTNNTWTKLGQDIDGLAGSNRFGYSLDLSYNGNYLASGSYVTGKARIYRYINNSWVQVGQDIEPKGNDGKFGDISISSNGDRVVIGSRSYSSISGLARVFSVPNNTCPVAINDTYSFVKQTPLNVGAAQGVLSNDVDVDNNNLIATLVSNSTRGDLSLNANGSFSYNACKNINLQGTFNAVTTNTGNWCPAGPGKVSQKQQFAWSQSGNNLYSVTGGDFTYGGYSACGYNQTPNGTLKVKYECGVLSPVGTSQWGEIYTFNSVETSADRSTLTIDWKNDYGESSISVLTDWAGGIWPILSHNDNYQESFTYMANDGTCNSNVAIVSLNVINNDCPVGVNDVYQVNKGGVLNIISAAEGVLINDTDAQNNILTAKVASPPLHGNLNLNSNGSFTYAHNGSDNTSDGFKYLANDGYCDSDTVFVTINVSYPTPTNGEWTQEGNDILPPNSFGANEVSISKDGSVVAVGHEGFDSNIGANNVGLIRVFKNVNNVWTQEANIEGINALDAIGRSISLSGDGKTVIAGSEAFDSSKGLARVYRKINNTWTKLGEDIVGEPGDRFGAQVSISTNGNRIAISASSHDGGKGTVRVYNWNGTTWMKMGQDIDGEAANDRSGRWRQLEISGDGNSVAIGSTTNGGGKGHTRVYSWNGNAWTQLGQDIDGKSIEGAGRVSLNDDGTIVAVGAYQNDGYTGNPNDNRGVVRIFEFKNNSWTQLGQDVHGNMPEDLFGNQLSISASGDTLAIGVGWNDKNGSMSGQVKVITYNKNLSKWEQLGQDVYGLAKNHMYGYLLQISGDGSRFVTTKRINGDTLRIFKFNQANICPVVNNESFDVEQGASINIPANQGLLVNDTDADGDNLSVSVLPIPDFSNDVEYNSYVYHGLISCQDPNDPNNGKYNVLCSNGSFKYENDGSFNATDTIRYKVSDGECERSGFAVLNIIGNADPDNWTKIGQDLIGEAVDDWFGSVVSMNKEGNIVAVGAPKNDNSGGSDAGQVRVFKYENNSWNQMGQDIDGSITDQHMGVVSISDDGLTLATSGYLLEASYSTQVFVYKFDNNVWNKSVINAPDNYINNCNNNCSFGYNVIISGDGNRLAISAAWSDYSDGDIWLYENDGNSWNSIGSINTYDDVGYYMEVSMNKDGSKIAFISDEENALVFQYIGNENWSQIGQAIEIDNGLSPNWQGIYGITLSGDGSTIAMNMDNCPDPQDMDCDDIVGVYKYLNNSWIQVGQFLNRTWDYDYLPISLNHDGTIIAVGDLSDQLDSEKGSVRTYKLKNDKWIQMGQAIIGLSNGDVFGHSVSLNSLGSKLVIGASQLEVNKKGYVQVYSYPIVPPVQTVFNFTASSSSEVEGKSVDINVKIENPNPNSSTTVDVVLTSGDSKDIGDFSSKTLTFPEGNYATANQKVSISITDDALEEGGEDVVFTLKNASGTATIGQTSTHTLTIIDNDGNVTGFENHESGKNINIFPNPTTGIINIRFYDTWNGNVQFKLFDAFGKQEAQNTIDNSSGNTEFQLDVSNRKEGVFFIELSQDDKKVIKKVIKK